MNRVIIMKVKKNDNVVVLTGKDKKKTGKVIAVMPKANKVVVEGVNVQSKSKKARSANETSQIIKKEGAIDASNVLVICPVCNKATRVAHAEVEGKKKADLTLVYAREGARDTVSVQTDSLFQVGAMKSGLLDYKVTTLEFSFFESFPAGVALGVNTLKGYVNDMKYVFTKEGAKSVGGFGTLGSIFPTVWDWHRFWEMTAFLSIILAFMNILPIPALDGGHVLFLLYEIIARRKPSDKFLEYAQMAGMILLFGLLIWANFNDILRFLF